MNKLTLIGLAFGAALAASSSFADVNSTFDNVANIGNFTQTGKITGISVNVDNNKSANSIDVFTDGKLNGDPKGNILTITFTGNDVVKGAVFANLIGKKIEVGYQSDMMNGKTYKISAISILNQ